MTPPELANPETHLLRLRKSLYGLSDSGYYRHDTLARELDTEIGLRVATGYRALSFSFIDDGALIYGMVLPYRTYEHDHLYN